MPYTVERRKDCQFQPRILCKNKKLIKKLLKKSMAELGVGLGLLGGSDATKKVSILTVLSANLTIFLGGG